MASRTAGVPRKYATSLFSAATKLKKLDVVEKDVKIVKDLYATNQQFAVSILYQKVSKPSFLGFRQESNFESR
jgi:F0F1-type ATP synthase delta subunit